MQTTEVYAVNRDAADCVEVRTTELPAPPAGHARVRVEAAGVSYGDLLLQRGVIPGGPKLPFVPGYELAGVVESVGDGVTAVRPGQRVAALVHNGGYATAINLPAERLVGIPDGVDAERVAAVALNYFIAHQMLHRIAKITTGQSVVVHGASGGVGLAFLQLAEHIGGVTVFGTASAANHELVRRHGAVAVDYRNEDFAKVVRDKVGAVHAAFDPIGGPHFWRSYGVLRRGGTMVGYGQSAVLQDGKRNMAIGALGFIGGIGLPKLVPDGRKTTFYNAWALENKQPEAYAEDLAQVLELLSADKIAPRAITTLPLTDAAEAFERLESGVTGKLVLTCA